MTGLIEGEGGKQIARGATIAFRKPQWSSEEVVVALPKGATAVRVRQVGTEIEHRLRRSELPTVRLVTDERTLALHGVSAPGEDPSRPSAPPGELLLSLLELPYKEAFDRWVAHFERNYAQNALRTAGGSVSEAARRSGVTRRHIQRLMKRHGLRDE